MIPLKLQLKNFLSYGSEPQTIDFTPYNLICLCGKNGHGKSALLDAITWALWGTARKVLGDAKADVGLLRLGQTQMHVILDFVFNNTTYRVRREFAKTYGKPLAALEFGMVDPITQELIPLTDKTIRGTQAKIISTLNITAESFINSAFIRQGNANEFSQKAPKDRKKILANILGLAHYDHIRQLAQTTMKGLQLKKQALNTSIITLNNELTLKPSITERTVAITHHLERLAQEEAAINTQIAELKRTEQLMLEQQKTLHAYRTTHETMLQTQKQKQGMLQETWQALRTFNRQMATIDYQRLEAERQAIIPTLATCQDYATQRLMVHEQLLTVKEQLRHHEHGLKQQHERMHLELEVELQKARVAYDQCIRHMQELDATINKQKKLQQEYAHEEESLANAIKQETALSNKIQHIEQQFTKRKNYYQLFTAQGTWITKQLEELGKKQLLVHDDTNPSCPLCEQNLSAARKRFLKKSFSTHEHFLSHRCTRLKKIVTQLKQVLLQQHTELSTLNKEMHTIASHKARHAIITKEHARLLLHHADALVQQAMLAETKQQHAALIKTYEQQLADAQTKVAGLIHQDPMFRSMQNALHEAQEKFAALAHDQTHCTTLANKLKHIQDQLAVYTDNIQQYTLQEQRRGLIRTICQELKSMKCTIKEHAQNIQMFQATMASQHSMHEQKNKCEQELHSIRSQRETLIKEQGQVEQQLQRIHTTEQEHAAMLGTITTLDGEINDYEIIARSMGKDGLQALLIEEAIPEIEHEANKILAKLTDNQTHIFIESLKDLKNGSTKETLDIRVSDSMGIRPYEMFSGGEAFRIDFSLRVGIAKLLAHRAGTSLQTLIIDEGFGSQDEEGLHLIMDAIHRIQDDFAKIIIVSHLNSMKNQFPVHFLVQKIASGSTVHVIEQA